MIASGHGRPTSEISLVKPEPAMAPRDRAKWGMRFLATGTGVHGDEEPLVDIVALQSLGADPDHAWERNGVNWLKDLLPRDAPRARVMAWGDDISSFRDSPDTALQEAARYALQAIYAQRPRCEGRPCTRRIIFVAHSLGGILLKKILVEASTDRDWKSVLDSTVGIVYLGTPHFGLSTAPLGMVRILAKVADMLTDTPDLLLGGFFRNSAGLIALENQLAKLIPHCHIMCIYEMKKSLRQASGIILVPKETAVLPRRSSVGIQTDHSGLNKFASYDDEGYTAVSAVIMGMLDRIPPPEFPRKPRKIMRADLDDCLVDGVEGDIWPSDRADLSIMRGPQWEAITFISTTSSFDILQGQESRVRPFVGRQRELELLHSLLSMVTEDSVTLCGMPGVGKKQLAFHYAELRKDLYPYVFWVSAYTVNDFYTVLYERLGLGASDSGEPSREHRETSIKSWLKNENGGRAGGWLLILDRISEDMQTFIDGLPRGVKDGKVLFTTTSRSVAEKLGVCKNVMELSCLQDEEALELLSKLLGRTITGKALEHAHNLLEILGNHTVAITQAAKLMTTMCMSIRDFLTMFSKNDTSKIMALRRIGDAHPHLFEQAMLRPFEQLSPNAANILRLLSFFNPRSISLEMLRTGLAGTELWRVKLWADPVGDLFGRPREHFEQIITELESVSIIQKLASRGESTPVIRFHDLYQLLIRATMIPMNETTYWLEAAMLLLVGAIKREPSFRSDWETLETYRPHIVSLLRYMMAVPDRIHQKRFSQVFYDLGMYLRENGNYEGARDALTLAFNSAINDAVLGPEHTETLRIQVERAEVHQMLGQYTIAEAEYKEVLSTQKKTLNKTDPERLNTQQKLSSLGNVSGAYEKVVETCKAVERLMKRATPLELSYTKEQHAVALLHLGQDQAAEQLLNEVRESRERSLGHDHPQTLGCLQHLSLVYRIQERYKEAEDLCRHIPKAFEKTHGPAHLETIQAKIQLAYVLIYSDRPEQTKDLLTPHTLLHYLGPVNPHTLQAHGCLAHALERKCHFPEAAALYEEVHQQYEAQHGASHPLTLRALRDLARIKGLLGKAEEARGFFSLAVDGYTEIFGRGHPDTMECLQDYGGFLMRGGGYVEALSFLEEVLLGRRKLFRRGHPDIVVSEKAVEECVRCVGKIGGCGGT